MDRKEEVKKTPLYRCKTAWAGWKRMDAKHKMRYLAVAAIVAVILLLYASALVPGKQEPRQNEETENAQMALEQRLGEVLSGVAGAGRVEVLINFDSGTELVPALSEQHRESSDSKGEQISASGEQSKEIATVRQDGDTEALIIKEIQPRVRGVLVVAEGAGDIGVRLQLLEAVKTVLDVETAQVEVLKMGAGT